MNYWLVKQEPDSYAWSQFVADKGTAWTGVRNYQARIHLRAMKKGDIAFYYHSNIGKEIVGVATIAREAYPDKTAEEGDWVCVDLKPLKPMVNPLNLEAIKKEAVLADMVLVKNSRLSVQPVTAAQAERILKLGGVKL